MQILYLHFIETKLENRERAEIPACIGLNIFFNSGCTFFRRHLNVSFELSKWCTQLAKSIPYNVFERCRNAKGEEATAAGAAVSVDFWKLLQLPKLLLLSSS